MRFIDKPAKYKVGDIRIISKYLIIPVRIGNETRWLETACIKQELVSRFDTTCGASWTEWQNLSFE